MSFFKVDKIDLNHEIKSKYEKETTVKNMTYQETRDKKLILRQKIMMKWDLAKTIGSVIMIMERKSNHIIQKVILSTEVAGEEHRNCDKRVNLSDIQKREVEK